MGSPRGGTSLLAGVLHRAGVYMGAFRTKQYEDPEFKIPPERAFDAVAQLAPVIRSRNAQYEYWGWKLPNKHLLHPESEAAPDPSAIPVHLSEPTGDGAVVGPA
jgi:hypothetical protein